MGCPSVVPGVRSCYWRTWFWVGRNHMRYTPVYRHSGSVVAHLLLMYGMACTLGDNLFASPAELCAQWEAFQGHLLSLS